MTEEYQPFGPEWEKEMMKLKKSVLISLYRDKCKKEIELQKGIRILWIWWVNKKNGFAHQFHRLLDMVGLDYKTL